MIGTQPGALDCHRKIFLRQYDFIFMFRTLLQPVHVPAASLLAHSQALWLYGNDKLEIQTFVVRPYISHHLPQSRYP
jgi:hypothetical protein